MLMDTPAVYINSKIMMQNIDRMAAAVQPLGVQLRPHVKTHKIPDFAQKQLAAGASGITVAKVAEAEIMAEHGIADIFIAYPIVVRSKIERVLQLARKIELKVGVDSLEGASLLSAMATEANVTLQVRLEIETGLQRTGVGCENAVALAKQINDLPGIELNGIFTYKGACYQGKSTLDLQAAGREEGELMVAVAQDLRANGIAIQDVSVGSTPSGLYAAEVKGVTEIRPGTYIFNDAMQLKLGVCSLEDCAAHIITTVISTPTPELVIIDGGSKTFATDVQPNQSPLHLQGFGTIIGYPNAVLGRMNEEHGMISMNGPHDLKIGDTLSIVPNHICSTVNLHNQVYVEDETGLHVVTVLARGQLH